MKLERVRPTVLRVTLHPLELTALVSAARWVVDGGHGGLPADAVDQLRRVLVSYDEALARTARRGGTDPPGSAEETSPERSATGGSSPRGPRRRR